MRRVLVLEPSDDVRDLFARLLTRLGYEPIFDGSDATPDAVLMEPADIGALERARALRAARPSLPILCASIEERSAATHELAPAAYLLKPFGMKELGAALTDALE